MLLMKNDWACVNTVSLKIEFSFINFACSYFQNDPEVFLLPKHILTWKS